jgi:hypothetical protein
MTTRLAAAVAAGTLAVGILVGAAGTVLVHDATRPTMGMGDMAQMHQMMSGMGGSMMDGSMMGAPDASMDPAEHESHHRSDQ